MPVIASWFRAAAAALVFTATWVTSARADVISDWNAKAEVVVIEKRLRPPTAARTMAMMHVAMFEAVNAIDRRYAPYRLKLSADKDIPKDTAAAAAAYAVLTTLYPDQQPGLDTALRALLAGVPDGDPKTKAIELGKRAATEIMALRADDGINAKESYRPVTSPGVYIPTAVPVSSTDGAVTPWVMSTPSQFRAPPPPALTSETWTRDLNEIREVAGAASTTRTPEQSEIGRFWFMTGPRAWNPIVRQLAEAKKLDTIDSARLFALVALASTDSFIAVFEAKYHYNLWRPLTAIRNADITGNKATPRDASWLPFGQGSHPVGDTPMHPEYPCAHCISSSAAGNVLKLIVGTEIPEVSMTSPTAPNATRKWTSLQAYIDEVSSARIYAGFHYRFSTKAAEEMGRKIAELTVATQLRGASVSAAPPTR